MNPAPFTSNAAGPWTPVRQGDKEFVPAMGKRVLCRAGKHLFVARLELYDAERVWRWAELRHVVFEDVEAWAEIHFHDLGTPNPS